MRVAVVCRAACVGEVYRVGDHQVRLTGDRQRKQAAPVVAFVGALIDRIELIGHRLQVPGHFRAGSREMMNLGVAGACRQRCQIVLIVGCDLRIRFIHHRVIRDEHLRLEIPQERRLGVTRPHVLGGHRNVNLFVWTDVMRSAVVCRAGCVGEVRRVGDHQVRC